MALVNCPECGREKVSDTAESCPDCGYNIRRYYQRQAELESAKKEEQEQEKKIQDMNVLIDEFKEKEIIRLVELKEERIEVTKRIKEPTRPSLFIRLFHPTNGNGILTVILLLIIIFFGSIGFLLKVNLDLIIAFFAVIAFVIFLISQYYKYKSELTEYQKITADFDGYIQSKIDTIESEYSKKIQIIRNFTPFEFFAQYPEYSEHNIYADNSNNTTSFYTKRPKVKCPTCGSFDVKSISTVNRAVSIFAVGLASGKIGKQFECKNCGYKW